MTLFKKYEIECKSYECGIAESIAKPPEKPKPEGNERGDRRI